MIANETSTPVRAIVTAWVALAREQAISTGQAELHYLKVFLDGDRWLEDEIKPDIDFVEYVDDRRDADVCMSVTPDSSYGSAPHYRVRFTGAGRFAMIEASARLHLPKRQSAGYPRLQPANAESATV